MAIQRDDLITSRRGCRGTQSHGRGFGGVPQLFLPPHSRPATGGPREYQIKK